MQIILIRHIFICSSDEIVVKIIFNSCVLIELHRQLKIYEKYACDILVTMTYFALKFNIKNSV